VQFACRLETFDQGVLSATGDKTLLATRRNPAAGRFGHKQS
jgi:hypothetical protein